MTVPVMRHARSVPSSRRLVPRRLRAKTSSTTWEDSARRPSAARAGTSCSTRESASDFRRFTRREPPRSRRSRRHCSRRAPSRPCELGPSTSRAFRITRIWRPSRPSSTSTTRTSPARSSNSSRGAPSDRACTLLTSRPSAPGPRSARASSGSRPSSRSIR